MILNTIGRDFIHLLFKIFCKAVVGKTLFIARVQSVAITLERPATSLSGNNTSHRTLVTQIAIVNHTLCYEMKIFNKSMLAVVRM